MTNIFFFMKLDSGNSAFQAPDTNLEVARILIEVANQLTDGRDSGSCIDISGYKAGGWYLDTKEEDKNDVA